MKPKIVLVMVDIAKAFIGIGLFPVTVIKTDFFAMTASGQGNIIYFRF